MIPEDLYKTILDKMPVTTVDVVIVNQDGKALVMRRNNEPAKGSYYTIGGRLHKNETLLDCVIRILKLEAGISVGASRLKLIGVMEEIFENSPWVEINYHCVNVFFKLSVNDSDISDIKMDNQHSDFIWVGTDDLENLNVHEYAIHKIRTALEN